MYRKIITRFNVFIIICFVLACSRNNITEDKYSSITVNLEDNSLNLSLLFDSIRAVYLETNDSSLIGTTPKILFNENFIFIRSNNSIQIFDFEGKFKKTINKVGRGYGEYIAISDFYINEELERIEIFDKSQKKILYYNFNGDYLDNLSLDFWGVKIIRDSQNRLYVYSGYERDIDNIFKFNVISSEERHSFYEIDKKKSEYLHISNPINFYKNNEDEILFFEPFNDTIYTLHDRNIEPKYIISYNGRNVPESFYANKNFSNVFEFFQEYNKHDYINSTYNVIESDNKLLFYCLNGSDKYLVLYDKINDSAHSYNRIVDDLFSDNLELPFQNDDFVFFSKKSTIVFFIQPYWFIEHKDKIISSDLKMLMGDLNEEHNPILFVGKLK